MLSSFPRCPSLVNLKNMWWAWQLCKTAWWPTQRLWHYCVILMNMLVTKDWLPRAVGRRITGAETAHEPHHMRAAMCLRCNKESACLWQGSLPHPGWTNHWKIQPPTSPEDRFQLRESYQAWRWDPCHFWCSSLFKLPERHNLSYHPCYAEMSRKEVGRGKGFTGTDLIYLHGSCLPNTSRILGDLKHD